MFRFRPAAGGGTARLRDVMSPSRRRCVVTSSDSNMESGLKLSFWERGPRPGQFYSLTGGSSSTGPETACGPVRHTL